MSVRRVVPDLQCDALEENRTFYGLLGFEEVMNHGWVMTLASPAQPTAQLTFLGHRAPAGDSGAAADRSRAGRVHPGSAQPPGRPGPRPRRPRDR